MRHITRGTWLTVSWLTTARIKSALLEYSSESGWDLVRRSSSSPHYSILFHAFFFRFRTTASTVWYPTPVWWSTGPTRLRTTSKRRRESSSSTSWRGPTSPRRRWPPGQTRPSSAIRGLSINSSTPTITGSVPTVCPLPIYAHRNRWFDPKNGCLYFRIAIWQSHKFEKLKKWHARIRTRSAYCECSLGSR